MALYRKIRNPVVLLGMSFGLGYASFDRWPEHQYKYNVLAFCRNKTQTLNAFKVAYLSFRDYQKNVSHITDKENHRSELSEFYRRTAERIYELCKKSKGVYIKFGQYLSTLDRVIPKEVTDVLKKLQDQVPPHSLETMKIVLNNTVPNWNDQIVHIEEASIGSASLAQVHKAKLKTGEDIAIKIQYPELNKQFPLDMKSLTNLARMLTLLFKLYDISAINVEQILNKFKSSITKELDFINEIENSTQAQALFRDNSSVIIPTVYRHLSSKNVISMDYLPGIRIDDMDRITNQLHLDPKECGNILIDLYTKMIFDTGRIHCDPHPGNLLVRNHPTNPSKPQIVLLDHGFYRILNDDVRTKFVELWMALINGQSKEVKEIAKWFGIEKKANYLNIIFLFRTKNVRKLGESFTQEEIRRLREKSILSFDNIFQMLDEFPEDILMIIRTMNMISMRNMNLGNSNRKRLFTTTMKVYQKYYNGSFMWRLHFTWLLFKIWMYEKLSLFKGTFDSKDDDLDL